MSPRRIASVFPEPEMVEDDCDLVKRLDEESFYGENESLWLSSDCNSPSSFFSDYRLYDSHEWRLQVSRQLWFSLGRSIGFFDGSRINPIQEACLVLEKNLLDTEKFLLEDSREEEVVVMTWLQSSTENDSADSSSVIFSDSDSDIDRTGSSVSVADELEDFNTDELIFWPSKQKPENWDCFAMSPLKNINHRNAALIVPHTRKTDTDEVSRRLVFISGSTASKILPWKRRSSNNGVGPTSTAPAKPVLLESDNKILNPTDRKVLNQIFLEEDFAFAANEELPIEKLLGLDEFDGHEGVDSEFNKDDFSFDQSL